MVIQDYNHGQGGGGYGGHSSGRDRGRGFSSRPHIDGKGPSIIFTYYDNLYRKSGGS